MKKMKHEKQNRINDIGGSAMKRSVMMMPVMLAVACVSVVIGGIPEPNAIFYGQITLDGIPVTVATHPTLEIIGRVVLPLSEQEVGRYRMGENINAGDRYVLRAKLESLADGSTQSTTAALIGQTLRIYLSSDETKPVAEVVIPERGWIQELSLSQGIGCMIVAEVSPPCVVDARQPSLPDGLANPDNDGNLVADDREVRLTLSCDPVAAVLAAGDFGISVTGGTLPTIVGEPDFSGFEAILTLSTPPPPGQWTCFTLGASESCIGSLPGDADGNSTTSVTDVQALLAHLVDPITQPMDILQCDVDRSGSCGPADVLRAIDLLGGGGAYEIWRDRTLAVCPAPQ